MTLSEEERKARRKAYLKEYRTRPEVKAKQKAKNREHRATHKEERVAYYKKNREELNRKGRKHYQKNREAVIKRTIKYHFQHKESRKEWYVKYYQEIGLEVLARVDPDMKCAMCGCADTRFLEINHIKGGGNKELQGRKGENHNSSQNLTLLIHKGKRGTEDLNLLCRVCNSIDHLERVYGKTRLRTVWDKQVS